MPTSLHPQAKFDPIPPDLDLYGLVDRCQNFEWVLRISTHQIRNLGPEEFEKLVLLHVVNGGKPLVIEGWDEVLSPSLFSGSWLESTYDKKQEDVRDINGQTEIPMTTGHYLRSMKQLTNQWTPSNYRDERRQRLYLKDIDCPPEWHDALQKVIPPSLFYLNENVTDRGGGDRRNTDIFGGAAQASAASAGDLMSSLPPEMRAQNLMCYIGHEGTYTPAHREMCASLGQNIMVEASGDENGEKTGSSIWFMTETKDREVVREYFLSMLGHDVEIEKHFAQVNAWKKATFPVYIVDQRPGDFILIPPLAPHQVWNRGTRTMKVAWNRTTPETLDLAIHEALPKARLVCRDEQYKNKALIYYTLQKYHRLMQDAEEKNDMSLVGFAGFGQDLFRSSPRFKQLAGDFRRLFDLFTEILTDEMFATKEKNVEFVEFDSCVICSYCRSNIFNRFLTCKNCVRTLVGGDEDAYDVCLECYAMGRSCMCQSHLTWCEQFKWSDLVDNYEAWRIMVIKNDGFVDMDLSPPPLELARTRRDKKSTAQVCQEALTRRPFKDLTKVDEEKEDKAASDSDPAPELDDEGRPKKKKKKYRRKRKEGELRRCHVCCHKDYQYRVQECTNPACKEAYCYGVLYRAFDMMPQAVLEDENWLCPKCLGICNCGACRRMGLGEPYMPKNTLLGHDTKAIADDRSVELLVDFRVHNLNWLKAMGEESRNTNSKRMQDLRQKADVAKAQDEAGQATQDAIVSVNNGADGSQQPSHEHMNGYGDQSHLFQGDVDPSLIPDGEHEQDAHHDQFEPHPMDVTDGDMTNNFGDDSAYPDPLMGGQRMLGMGYYDQDNGPDQILFDPFQMPTADAMLFDEEAEVVKKALRAQKRKAKQQNDDDPDFYGPKSQVRKKKRDAVDLTSVDPALMGSVEPQGDASGVGTGTPDEETGPTAQLAGEAQQHVAHQAHLVNVPELRHARPRKSYAEADEMMIDEPEDLLPAWDTAGNRKPRAPKPHVDPVLGDEAPPDPLSEASDAVRALLTQGLAAGTDGETVTPRRRGRPRRSEMTGTPSTEPSAAPGGPSAADVAAERRAARANRRSTLSAVETAATDDEEMGDERSRVLAEIEAGHDEVFGETAPAVPRRRGRPPKIRPPPVEGEEEAPRPMSMAERMAARGKKFKMGSTGTRGARKSRGGFHSGSRPSTPSTAAAEGTGAASPTVATTEAAQQATQDAASSRGGTSEPPVSTKEKSNPPDADDEVFQFDDVPDSPSASEAEATPKPARQRTREPTVVRLGGTGSASGSDFEGEDDDDRQPTFDGQSGSGSEDSDSSDASDIYNEPSQRAQSSRGRGSMRGRPRGRGRGRGRPRGRPRGS
ncbi:JmjC domain-containing protein [Plectosphaerella plurivora]|uniref:JmjC domain-containing protein n=1 Tax=Plectosphaerella plurivora TaxID=936078 RepID=A0A9P8VDC8_9PEZI|nr:JmjC domain-containing protein [Plectosphaerella plurivora]